MLPGFCCKSCFVLFCDTDFKSFGQVFNFSNHVISMLTCPSRMELDTAQLISSGYKLKHIQ